MSTYNHAPHLAVPKWLQGPAWLHGPCWVDASAPGGRCGASVLRLDDGLSDGPRANAPSIRVWVDESAAPASVPRYVVAWRPRDDVPEDTVEYQGPSEAAARAAIAQRLLNWRAASCTHCATLKPCGAHGAPHVRCTTCGMQTLDVRASSGEVWCSACGSLFLPITTAWELAESGRHLEGRGVRLVGGTTVYDTALAVHHRGGRHTGGVRLTRRMATKGALKQVHRYVPGDALCVLVEAA